LWKQFRPESLATTGSFERDPRLVWEWYDWRRQKIAACQPNAAHTILAGWGHRFSNFNLVTQNVDGLHERAGSATTLRLHGSIWDVQCWNHCANSPARWRDDTVPHPQIPPTCPHCGGLLRPGVVWFGEALDSQVVASAAAAARCDVFFTIGTSAVVYPAAALVQEARRHKAFTIEINPEATPASTGVDVVLRGPAEEVLAQIDALLVERPRR
jgi:NAD-dependent deacetylase